MALIPSFSPAITFFFCGLLLFCLGSFLPARFRRYKHKLHSGSKPRTIWDLEIAKKILNGSWSDIAANIHDKPPSLLEARARSNVRLKHAFHIDNSFTTTDAKYHMEFRKLAVQLVSLKGDQWVRLAERAQEAVDRTLSHLQSSQDDFFRVPLVPLIQASVLGTVLSMLYPQHWNRQVSPKEQNSALLTVSELIDTLWIASKSSTTSSFKNSEPTAAFQDLQAALRLLLPGMPCSSGSAKDNPLNLLLPSYETLWRLVLMCLLEIRFRRSPEIQRKTQRMQLQLKSLLKDTGDQNFKFANKTTGVSGSDIINEALRLYPPTKRIYRQLQPLGDVEVDEVAIDIEHLHRDAEIWGEDAQLFRPERWRHVSNIQLQSFIPFGAGKSVCPAKVSFGPKAAAILTAALLEKITGDWELVSTGGDENIAVLNSDAVLTNERGAYKNLYLLYRSD